MKPPERDLVLWNGAAVDAPEWTTSAAPGSVARLGIETATTGTALRFDFELAGPGSWAIARRALAAAVPAHYVATLRLRGEARPNQLQVKIVDPSGANVWWWRRALEPRREAARLVFRRAALEFAWGPADGGEPE